MEQEGWDPPRTAPNPPSLQLEGRCRFIFKGTETLGGRSRTLTAMSPVSSCGGLSQTIFQVEVLWVVPLCSVVVGYHRHDSSVGIALGYRPDDRGSRVRFLAEAGNFSLHHRVQNGSGAHPASYPVGTRKRPRREASSVHSPNMPSWRGAQLKHRDNFTFVLTATIACSLSVRSGLPTGTPIPAVVTTNSYSSR
jgi:hypothetical protein